MRYFFTNAEQATAPASLSLGARLAAGPVWPGWGGVSAWIFNRLRSWSLARQFGTCASIVLVPAMVVIGVWVGSQIEEGATQRAGSSALLYMESFVEPLIQELGSGAELSPTSVERLGRLLQDTSLGQRVLTFKIWRPGGVVVASSRPDIVGKQFPLTPGLIGAFRGVPKVKFEHLTEVENLFEQKLGVPILEVYVPLRAIGSDEVIAVGEFYEKATELKAELNRARLLSWLVVASVTLSMLAALFAIVRRGSQTIERQHTALAQRVGELTELLAENQHLRERARQASARASESNEGFLRRLGADLHDGPAQLISAVLLRVDVAPEGPEQVRKGLDTVFIRNVLTDALRDIRNLARGLAVPEIDAIPLDAALRHAIDQHCAVTATQVAVVLAQLPDVPPSVKLCAYRFVQEGLTNAFKHAGGVGQAVDAWCDDGDIVITVSDAGGEGLVERPQVERTRGFGLRALADRIESIGGMLRIERSDAGGTQLVAILPLFRAEMIGAGDAIIKVERTRFDRHEQL
jgi:signal transduction histidine kinase